MTFTNHSNDLISSCNVFCRNKKKASPRPRSRRKAAPPTWTEREQGSTTPQRDATPRRAAPRRKDNSTTSEDVEKHHHSTQDRGSSTTPRGWWREEEKQRSENETTVEKMCETKGTSNTKQKVNRKEKEPSPNMAWCSEMRSGLRRRACGPTPHAGTRRIKAKACWTAGKI